MQARTGMTATAAILFVCGGAWLSARQGRPDQAPPFRTGTEVVSIDVGVVDKRGQPMRGLGPGDFTVTVGGQPRAVVSAEFVDLAPALDAAAPPPDTGVISTNEGAGVGRTILFVVDQNTLDLGAARQVARSSAHFFTGLTFADRSALALLPVGPNVQFTWAHARVSDALQRVVGTGGTRQTWEYGSIADARDISNTGTMALRTLGERECGGTTSAGAGSSGGGGGGGAAPTGGGGGGPQGPTGGEAPAGAGGGGGGGETQGGQGGGGGTTGGATGGQGGGGGTSSRGSGSSGGFGMNSCLRDLQMQADSAWRMAHATSLTSVTSLRQTLASLADVRGDKTVILISGGWPLDQRDEVSLMATIASEAAAVRATIHTIFVPASTFAADRRGINFGSTRDQYIHLGPLETLAAMTGGGTFRADVNADVAFETLRRELAGHYRIGVERVPGDLGAKNRRMKVQVSRSGLAVRARELFEVRTYEDRDWAARLASALESPVAATGVGLRMTSYLTSDPEDSGRLKVVLAGEASRLQPGEATFQILVRDLEGKAILSGEKPLGTATGGTLPFSADVPVSPGSYIVRLAVMDGAGRVGSLDHRVEARPVPLGKLSASRPLLVRVPADRSIEPSVALDGVRQDERLALQVDLEGDREHLGATSVVFEIAPASGGAPLVESAATLSQGSRNTMLAQGVADVRLLPPGPYMVHARVTAGGEAQGEVRRAFTVMEAPRAAAASVDVPVMTVDGGTRPKFSARGTIPPFAVEQVLDREVLGGFLDKVGARPDAAAPPIRALLERARDGRLDALDVSETLAADAPVAAFLQGLSLLARNKLDPAAISFRRALNAAGDFYPAMVYLGACYAAGGREKEAANAWRTALIKEGEAIAVHVLLTDSLLRQDRGDLALQAIERARKRWPEHDGLKRRYAMSALLAGRYQEGFDAVEDLVASGVKDEPSLALALLALYEAFSRGSAIEDVEQDRARMIRLADAYRTQGGPSLALVNAWVAAATLKR